MGIKDILKRMVIHYFIIFTGTMFATYIYCSFFYPDLTIDLHYLSQFMGFALVGDLPLLVFYSKHELTDRQIKVRYAIHFLLLELVLTVTAYKLEFYQNCFEASAFCFAVLVIYMLVRVVNFFLDKKTAKSINERLREMNGKE